jgi:hypothetical protein
MVAISLNRWGGCFTPPGRSIWRGGGGHGDKAAVPYVRFFVVLSYGEIFTVGMKRVAGADIFTFVGFSTLKRLLWAASFELCDLRKRDFNFQDEM